MQGNRLIWIILFGFLTSFSLFAQEGQPQARSILEIYIVGGGWIGAIIILLSIAMVALVIEHLITIQRDKLVPPEVIVQLEEAIEQEQYDEALQLCDAAKNYVSNIVGSALSKVNDGYESMISAAESQVEEENLKLGHKVSYLLLLGNVAPMLGLFGTVVGMVQAFTKIASKVEPPTPPELAGGIYTALVTTVWGLVVAIPALTAYYLFKNKIQRLTFEFSAVASELIEKLKTTAQSS